MIRFKLSFSRKVIGLAAWMVAASLGPVGAQPQTPAPATPSPQGETAEQKARREQDLKVLEEAISANAEARRRLESEVESIKADRAKLNTALIETAARLAAERGRPALGLGVASDNPAARRLYARLGFEGDLDYTDRYTIVHEGEVHDFADSCRFLTRALP